MSGDRYLLDTNAVAAILQGDKPLLRLLRDARWIGISIISQIEMLSFTSLSDADRAVLNEFVRRIEVIGLHAQDTDFISLIVRMRQQHHLKLPDAIIAASAIQNTANLVTEDSQLKRVYEARVIGFRQG
jgi:predicted nucleic acid-binding protein